MVTIWALLVMHLTLLSSVSQLSHHVLGEQKQSGDRDVSDAGPKPSGQEQPEVPRGRRWELWGAATPAGHLGEQRHAEVPAGCSSAPGTVCHPRGGLRPGSTRGRVRALLLSGLIQANRNSPLAYEGLKVNRWRFGMWPYHKHYVYNRCKEKKMETLLIWNDTENP